MNKIRKYFKRLFIVVGLFFWFPLFSVFTNWVTSPSDMGVYVGFVCIGLLFVFLGYVCWTVFKWVEDRILDKHFN